MLLSFSILCETITCVVIFVLFFYSSLFWLFIKRSVWIWKPAFVNVSVYKIKVHTLELVTKQHWI